ncbi:hypothetical protein DYB34_010699 [Aphanomyces astaci]|uniref:Uncharacterized protein n=1 Tax=Aphanomyces astaci TaxID=112090 RepID=A0A418BFR9_APHAT|nr:hypothetical protein DYB34_010699 [Aphanomyces astaci]
METTTAVVEILDSPVVTPRMPGKKTPQMKLHVDKESLDDEIGRRQIEKSLKRAGWKYIEGKAFGGAYCKPSVKLMKSTGKLSGVHGVDYFDSLETFEDHVRSTPALMDLVRRDLDSGHLNDPHQELLTPEPLKPKKRLSYSGIAKSKRHSIESAPLSRDLDNIRFGEIDNILTGRGWKCVDGPLGFVYCKPHVKVSGRKTKFTGKEGQDFFYGRDDLEQYVRSHPHLLKSIRDELFAPPSDDESNSRPSTPNVTTPIPSTPKASTASASSTKTKAKKDETPKSTGQVAKAKKATVKDKASPALLLPKKAHRRSLETPSDTIDRRDSHHNAAAAGDDGHDKSLLASTATKTSGPAATKKRTAAASSLASNGVGGINKKPRGSSASPTQPSRECPPSTLHVTSEVLVEAEAAAAPPSSQQDDKAASSSSSSNDQYVENSHAQQQQPQEQPSSSWRCTIQ